MEQEMQVEQNKEPQSIPETSSAQVQTPYSDQSTPSKASDDSLPSTPSQSEAGSRASSERGTPNKVKGETTGPTSFDTASSCSSTSSINKGKLPFRPGIVWKKGERVEAMDFMKKWYPAKIVEVDEEEEDVLIHFEGWNQRYDEWVPMTSDKLRPKTRHSERKDKKKKLHSEYKIGEHVYAKWTDCKMYPGKITNILPDGAFEVVFYDGFKKLVQPINVRPVPQTAQKQQVEIVHVLPKEARKRSLSSESADNSRYRSRRASLPIEQTSISRKESEKGQVKQEDIRVIDGKTVVVKTETTTTLDKGTSASTEKQESMSEQKEKEITPTKYKKAVHVSEKKSDSLKEKSKTISKEKSGAVMPSRDKTKHLPSKDKSKTLSNKSRSSLFPKNKKLIVAPSFFVKREKANPASSTVPSAEESVGLHIKEEPAVIEHIEPTAISSILPTIPLTVPAAEQNPSLNLKENEVKKEQLHVMQNKGDNSLPPDNIHSKQKKAKKRTVSPSASETSYSSESQSEDGLTARRRSRSTDKERGATYALVTGPPPKAFVIEQDHNQYKCVFEGCNKSFRKENLLTYHIKYYHTDNKPDHQPQPPPKRRKTSSICSTDSDVSLSSKQRSASGSAISGSTAASRKQRHVSADSVLITTTTQEFVNDTDNITIAAEQPETTVVEVTNSTKHERTPSQDTMATEESMETEDELSRDEVVNCACGYNEENGLMIQCDVCLCWQHAACFDITTETLPSKYVCFVCENPPGIRDSCRYVHEQDWLKLGRPAQFSFLNIPEDENKCLTMQATNTLIADIHNINAVLFGLRQKIKHVKNKDHPEHKLWKRNWDAEDTISLQDENYDAMSLQEDNVEYTQLEEEDVSMETSDKPETSESLLKLGSAELRTLPDVSEMPEESKLNIEKEGSNMVSLLGNNIIPKSFDLSSIKKCESSNSLATESTLTAVDENSQFSLDAEPSGVSEDIQVETSVNSNMINFGNEISTAQNMEEKSSDRQIVEEDPYKDCEKNLLEHILRVQSEIDSRLDFIDEQVILLESAESTRGNNQPQDILADLPLLKKSLHILENDLIRVQRLSAYHR